MKTMITLLSLLVAAALLSASGVRDAKAESLTWQFRNSTAELLMLELRSQSRPAVWPGNREVYYLPADGEVYTFPISCISGEYICYGAWIGRQPLSHWGVGRSGREGCTGCCYYCSGGQTQVHNLVSAYEGC